MKRLYVKVKEKLIFANLYVGVWFHVRYYRGVDDLVSWMERQF